MQSYVHGSRHIFDQIQRIKFLDQNVQTIGKPIVYHRTGNYKKILRVFFCDFILNYCIITVIKVIVLLKIG